MTFWGEGRRMLHSLSATLKLWIQFVSSGSCEVVWRLALGSRFSNHVHSTCIRKRGVPSLDSRQMARTELSLGASLRFLPKLERHQAFHSGTKMRLPHTRYSVALQFQHSRLIIYITDWNSIYNQICQLWPWESFYLESYSVYSFRCYCQDSVAETLGPNSD